MGTHQAAFWLAHNWDIKGQSSSDKRLEFCWNRFIGRQGGEVCCGMIRLESDYLPRPLTPLPPLLMRMPWQRLLVPKIFKWIWRQLHFYHMSEWLIENTRVHAQCWVGIMLLLKIHLLTPKSIRGTETGCSGYTTLEEGVASISR